MRIKFFACKTGHILYRWKANVMLINICRGTIPWKPMVFELQPFKHYAMTSSLCGRIAQISDILRVIYHWEQKLILIDFYYRTMPFKLQIWELQNFKCDVWKRSILLTSRNRGTFKGEIFISENQNLARLNSQTELVSQDIILFKTDGIVHFF